MHKFVSQSSAVVPSSFNLFGECSSRLEHPSNLLRVLLVIGVTFNFASLVFLLENLLGLLLGLFKGCLRARHYGRMYPASCVLMRLLRSALWSPATFLGLDLRLGSVVLGLGGRKDLHSSCDWSRRKTGANRFRSSHGSIWIPAFLDDDTCC